MTKVALKRGIPDGPGKKGIETRVFGSDRLADVVRIPDGPGKKGIETQPHFADDRLHHLGIPDGPGKKGIETQLDAEGMEKGLSRDP